MNLEIIRKFTLKAVLYGVRKLEKTFMFFFEFIIQVFLLRFFFNLS